MSEEITQDILKEFLHYNPITGVFTWKNRKRKWFVSLRGFKAWNARYPGKQAGCMYKNANINYMMITLFHKQYKLHRVIWFYLYGEWPEVIDHINGIGTDNRAHNIRNVTAKENSMNCKVSSNNKTGVTGVCWNKKYNKWLSYIAPDRKHVHLGYFDNFLDAICARKSAEVRLSFHENHGRAT